MSAKGCNKEDDEARRERYLIHRLAGIGPTQSARLAGYKNPRESCRDLEKRPALRDRIQNGLAEQRQEAKWSRNKVMEGIEEAINMGKIISDPSSMIRGLQEINKMQGYYAVETKEIVLTDDRAQRLDQISNMDEAELLARLGKDEAYIDAEFEEVPNDGQDTTPISLET